MKFKNIKVYGLDESILRSGYPMQVGEPQDFYDFTEPGESLLKDLNSDEDYTDLQRATRLAKASSGSGHNNFLKGIIVQFDLQYPEYFSPQLQRYHWINIISSQSKMHKLTSRDLTFKDFTSYTSITIIETINLQIRKYKKEENSIIKEEIFKKILSNLPSGYLKWMGISTNYLQLKTIYNQRKHHKLKEWREFCTFIEELPISNLIIEK